MSPARVALTVEAASVRASAVIFAPNRTVAMSYAGVLAAQTPQSLSAAIGAYYTGTSSLTVDAVEAPIVLLATQQAPPPPMPPMLPSPAPPPPSCLIFERCLFGLPPPLPDVLFLGLLTVVVLGAVLLWCLCRRRRRLREQRRTAEKEQRRTAEKEQRTAKERMSAVSLQARARSLLAKRTLQQARTSKEVLVTPRAVLSSSKEVLFTPRAVLSTSKEVREAAATRVQASVRKSQKLRRMQREFAAMLEAERLDQLQRQARANALRHTVRRRHALSTMTEFLKRRARKASMKVQATMIVQDYARRWFSARESHADSVYRRARANWLRMSRFIRRRHQVAIEWRAMADAVLETARGDFLSVTGTTERPLFEAVQALWQVVWRWIGSPPALQLAPLTPSRLAKHRLLCQLRLASLCDRLRPREPTAASIALQQLRALTKPTPRLSLTNPTNPTKPTPRLSLTNPTNPTKPTPRLSRRRQASHRSRSSGSSGSAYDGSPDLSPDVRSGSSG